ncbi:MAG: DUF1802 family protein [Roseofilum sp. SBFL]|uniref:DUF1802 family protein n=1 Tax=unclassified Roseofilum TaxID=2620099 RepID=UPI001B10C485|nr:MULTISPECIES: DUF1802 family protein [unclassified Roseofilum]MBP0011819.1 DUF1802 family protein [Roseofilum sp. SID3]MBP0024401.1 DUF1802 family protein [Roseofilum sp. SID2]MBP0038613.1 DUF1802 family protein [Roseofilum sp. SID1]MBP0041015.1 DUF1802 family protein [Roseofilum sp. SBFL]
MVLSTTRALKEWEIAIQALETGEIICLWRKGGIQETEKRFQVDRDWIWLYPTYEHQKPSLLKPVYAAQVKPVPSGWHPDKITISSGAKVTDVLELTEPEQIQGLFHNLFAEQIWTEDFISDRLRWKPQKPLSLLLLRVYRLSKPAIVPYDASYGGCKSWIDLQITISGDRLSPVLNDSIYEQRCNQIRALCAVTGG